LFAPSHRRPDPTEGARGFHEGFLSVVTRIYSRIKLKHQLTVLYTILDNHFGPLNWWPGETPFEIAVGAILTQNTNWRNVERAIQGLKSAGLLQPGPLLETDDHLVAGIIRPSGYYRIKTRRLKAFVSFLSREYGGEMDRMFEDELWDLRAKLLAVKGIGEETADSILLYAGNMPVFVVDAYTRRILSRHGIVDGESRYGEIQKMFMEALPDDPSLFNQYHALLVNTCKQFCKKRPLCDECPLDRWTAHETV